MRQRFIAWLAATALRLLGRTWRVRNEGTDPRTLGRSPNVAGLWHRNLLMAAFLYRDLGYAVPVSQSRDGELVSEVMRRLGFRDPPRGSSSRGGAGVLRSLVRCVEEGTTAAILTDGPRGPARHSKPGLVSLARLTDIPITPVSLSARPAFRFRSWDGTLLPLPFARVICRYGDPLPVARHCTPADEERLMRSFDDRLNADTDCIDARLGRVDPMAPGH